jgi:hypothetical protein
MLPRLLLQEHEECDSKRRVATESIELAERTAPDILCEAVSRIVRDVQSCHPAEHRVVSPDQLGERGLVAVTQCPHEPPFLWILIALGST